MTNQIDPQVLLNEQIEKFRIVTEKIGVEKLRHALLLKLVEERNQSPFDTIEFPKLNELIEEVYRELGSE